MTSRARHDHDVDAGQAGSRECQVDQGVDAVGVSGTDFVGDRGDRVVDDGARAQGLQPSGVGRGAGGQDGSAARGEHLDRERAGTAGSPDDEHDPAGLRVDRVDGGGGGSAGQGQRGRREPVQPGGLGGGAGRGQQRVLGQRAGLDRRG